MISKSEQLAARRRQLVLQCAEQRATVAYDVSRLKSPETMGGATGFVAQNKTAVLAAVGVGLGIIVTKPKWVVALVTTGLSAYKVAQKVLPVLGWRKFEIH